jgi:hypothetical protein
LSGLRRSAPTLRTLFGGFGVAATEQTSEDVVSFLVEDLGTSITRRPADGKIGKHRRAAVELAQDLAPRAILYSDLDHVLRWIIADIDELASFLRDDHADLMVVGRSVEAMAACPARLRDTEAIVNHIYELVTGRKWDLMFATRLMSPAAAQVVVGEGREDSIANDVEWPLIVENAGLGVGYRAMNGLSYRIAQEFDAAADVHDADPIAWIERVRIAHLHAQAIERHVRSTAAREPGR